MNPLRSRQENLNGDSKLWWWLQQWKLEMIILKTDLDSVKFVWFFENSEKGIIVNNVYHQMTFTFLES